MNIKGAIFAFSALAATFALCEAKAKSRNAFDPYAAKLSDEGRAQKVKRKIHAELNLRSNAFN